MPQQPRERVDFASTFEHGCVSTASHANWFASSALKQQEDHNLPGALSAVELGSGGEAFNSLGYERRSVHHCLNINGLSLMQPIDAYLEKSLAIRCGANWRLMKRG